MRRPPATIDRLFALFVLLSGAAASLAAQSWAGDTAMEVRVEDAKGKPVEGAEVALTLLQGRGVALMPLLTDAKGRAAVGSLAAGSWAIEVRKSGFMLYQAEIALAPGEKPSVVSALQQNVPGATSTLRVRFARTKRAPEGRAVASVSFASAPPAPPATSAPAAEPVEQPEPGVAPVDARLAFEEPPAPDPTVAEAAPSPVAPAAAVPMPAAAPEPVSAPEPEVKVRDAEEPKAASLPRPTPAPPRPEPAPSPTEEPIAEVAPVASPVYIELTEEPAELPPPVEPVPLPATAPAPRPMPATPPAVAEAVPAPEVEAPPSPAPMPARPPAAASAPVAAPAVEAPAPHPDPVAPPSAPASKPRPAPVPVPTQPAPAAEAAPEPVAPSRPKAPTVPVVAPAPTPPPAVRPVQRVIDQVCRECRSGESAQTVAIALAGGEGCPAGLRDRLADAADAELAGIVAGLPAGCVVLRAELAAGQRFSGFRYQAQAGEGIPSDCLPSQLCRVGGCRFVGAPVLRRTASGTTLLAIFESSAERTGLFSVYGSSGSRR